MCWVKVLYDGNISQIFLSFGNGVNVDHVYMGLKLLYGPYFGIGQNNIMFSILTNQSLTVNKWQHLAATWDGRKAFLYIDGIKVATTTNFGMPTNKNRTMCYIGRYIYNNQLGQACYDDIRIYNRFVLFVYLFY